MSDKQKILIVDDDPRMCDSLKGLLGMFGCEMQTANSGSAAIECLNKNAFDLVLLDMVMRDMGGFKVMDHINRVRPDTLVIILTGHASTDSAIEALRRGAYDYLRKPFEVEELLKTIDNALDHKRLMYDHKRVEEALRKSESELIIRNRINQIFLTLPDDEMYGEVLQVVLEATESRYGVFGYIDQDGALICPCMTREIWGMCQIPDKDISFPREQWGGIWGRALIEKKTHCSNGPFHVPGGHIPVFRSLAVPIIHHGEVIGLIHAANKDTDYDKKDQELLESIADHIAPILHARLQSDRKESERERMEEELRLQREILKNMAEGVVLIRASDLQIVYSNPKFEKMLGYGPGELNGKPITVVNHEDESQRAQQIADEILEELIQYGESTFEVQNVKKNGEPLWCWTHTSALDHPEHGKIWISIHSDINERKLAEEELREAHNELERRVKDRTYELGERVKELDCLYGVSKLREKFGISLEEILQGIVDLIPPSWQYPEVTCARAILEGKEFRTENFQDTIWKQVSDIMVHGEQIGTLEVLNLEEMPESDEGPFLKEERNLLNAIAERLGRIIEHKRAEESLRESEERFRNIFSESPIGIKIYDSEGQLLDANRAYLEIFGISEILKTKDVKLFDEPFIPDEVKETLRRYEPVRYEFSINFDRAKQLKLYETDKTGMIYLDVLITPLALKKEAAFWGYLVQVQDISERKGAEDHIHTLSQQLLKAQESERQRISRELHDRVGQDLSTLRIACGTLFDDQPEVPHEIRQRVSEMSKTIQGTVMAVRDLAYDLRPPFLDQLGLVRTVFQYCEDFSDKNGVKVDLYCAGMDEIRIDFDTEINLYRLVQEGLNNIKKHADASNATIRLVASFPKIILRIEDDGKGFDVKDRLVTALNEKRMGLRSMEERVGLLQGKMRINSRLMEGTKIFIEVPYKGENSDSEEEEHIDR